MSAALFTFSIFFAHPREACATVLSADDAGAVHTYARLLTKINPHLGSARSRDLAYHVLLNASRWHIDANMLVALVTVESRWRPSARSRVGALGLGQLMPGTAHHLGVNPYSADQNLSGCAKYLHNLLGLFRNKINNYQLAFAAYNAGPKAVQRYHGIPPYTETQHYVVRVMRNWKHFSKIVHVQSITRELAASARPIWDRTPVIPASQPAVITPAEQAPAAPAASAPSAAADTTPNQ